MKSLLLPRMSEARETFVEDRTRAHADHVGAGLDRLTTAAVGLLKGVNCGNRCAMASDQEQFCRYCLCTKGTLQSQASFQRSLASRTSRQVLESAKTRDQMNSGVRESGALESKGFVSLCRHQVGVEFLLPQSELCSISKLTRIVSCRCSYAQDRVVKDVIAFEASSFVAVTEKLQLDLHEPPMSQVSAVSV